MERSDALEMIAVLWLILAMQMPSPLWVVPAAMAALTFGRACIAAVKS